MTETNYVMVNANGARLDHEYSLRIIGPLTEEQAREIVEYYEPWETDWREYPETFEHWKATTDDIDDD